MACPARNSWTRLIQLQFAYQVRRAHVAEKVLEYINLAFVDRVAIRSVLLNSSGTLIGDWVIFAGVRPSPQRIAGCDVLHDGFRQTLGGGRFRSPGEYS